MLDLYLIRHAESRLNTEPHIIGGQAKQDGLSERGMVQARLLGERLKKEGARFDAISASTAFRTQETCQIACHAMARSVSDLVTSDDLLEISQGEFEGRQYQDVYTAERLALIDKDPWNYKAPRGESHAEVYARMMRHVQEKYITDPKHKDGCCAIWGHGMAIKCFVAGVLKSDPHYTYIMEVDNTGITQLRYSERGWHLVRFNDAAHLPHSMKMPGKYAKG